MVAEMVVLKVVKMVAIRDVLKNVLIAVEENVKMAV